MTAKADSPFTCRLARPSDLEALLALEQTSFTGDRLSRRQMRYHLHNPRARFWAMADKHDRPAAALLGFFHTGRPPRLYSLATDPACRGKGLGEKLVQCFIKEARKSGAARAVLEVRADATGAIRLYEKLGFVKIRDLPGYYEDGADGIKMVVYL